MGRPTLKWMEDLEMNLREMKVKRLPQKVVDREEWVSNIKEATALRRPQSQGVKVR
jgi:hypothetical protein